MQLEKFTKNLPNKPYCTNNPAEGLKIRTKKRALEHSHIQINHPNSKTHLIFDIDRETSPQELAHELFLPRPTLFIQNKENGHAHALYELKTPIHLNETSSARAIEYAVAVEHALGTALGADPNYVGLITKNPLHERWRVDVGPSYELGYELGELAEWLTLSSAKEREKSRDTFSLGRNCFLFNMLRKWSYNEVRAYRERTAKEFRTAVKEKAEQLNRRLEVPLPLSEVFATAKSVAGYCLKKDMEAHARFIETQKHRNKLSVEARRNKSSDKRTQAQEMASVGASKAEIARTLDVHRNTVNNWLK
jgi:hypothetical protein